MAQVKSAQFAQSSSQYLTGASGLANFNEYTIYFRVKSATNDGCQIISTDNSGRAAGDFRFVFNGAGNITWVMDTGAADNSVASTTDIVDDTWHTVIITCDGSTMKLYIDGTQEGGDVASTVNLNAQGRVWYIGVRFNLIETDYFNGLLNDLRVWSRALSGAEASSITSDPCNFSNGSNFEAWYEFEDNFSDTSTLGTGGTLTNNNSVTFSADIPYSCAVGPTNLKTKDGVAKANIKTIDGVAIANIKTVDGIE